MELLLEEAEGCPEGSLLSVKVGDCRQQAPAGKLGQVFRFATPPSDPVPIEVELLQPVAKPQVVRTELGVEKYGIFFGQGISVRLNQRGVSDLSRAPVDVSKAAQAQGLPADKIGAAESGAKYLEEHGLVQILQDLLHGLLTTKPADPLSFIEEKIVRTKAVATANSAVVESALVECSGEPQAVTEEVTVIPKVPDDEVTSIPKKSPDDEVASIPKKTTQEVTDETAQTEPRRSSVRCSIASQTKVEALLMSLHKTHTNINIAIPLLPDDLRALLTSDELQETCKQHFNSLDVNRTGQLSACDLVPVVVTLCNAQGKNIGAEQCRKLVDMFDADVNGVIDQSEFTTLVKYVIVTWYLATPEGAGALEKAQMEESQFAGFIKMIEADLDLLWTLMPFLPEHIVSDILSDAFMSNCSQQFMALDVDGSGQLEPMELIPVVSSLCADLQITINVDRCKRFIELFDSTKSGTISIDKFVEFVQFVSIMNYLTGTEEGQKVMESAEEKLLEAEAVDAPIDIDSRGRHEESIAMEDFLSSMERDREVVRKVLGVLPKELFDHLTSKEYVEACHAKFISLDADRTGVLRPLELAPLVVELSQCHVTSVTEERCKHFTSIFDVHGDGVLRLDEFLDFARFLTVMSYLNSDEGSEACNKAVEIMEGSKRIDEMLEIVKVNKRDLQSVFPYLPASLRDYLVSNEFMSQCMTSFRELDADNSGTLEPDELFPLILLLADAGRMSLEEEHCKRFASIFDDAGEGFIRKEDYVKFCRFMLIMGHLDGGAAGQQVMSAAEKAASEQPAEQPASPREDSAYQEQIETLTRENSALHSRVRKLEDFCAGIEAMMAASKAPVAPGS